MSPKSYSSYTVTPGALQLLRALAAVNDRSLSAQFVHQLHRADRGAELLSLPKRRDTGTQRFSLYLHPADEQRIIQGAKAAGGGRSAFVEWVILQGRA